MELSLLLIIIGIVLAILVHYALGILCIVIGLVLLAPALAGILLGLSNLSRDGGIGPTGVLVPLVAGVALLAAFCAWALAPGDRQPIVESAQ